MEARRFVDGKSEEGGDDEGVNDAGDDVGDLNVKLFPVVVYPAAVYDACVDAVQADDIVGGEECVENEANDAGDAVLGEDIEGVVNADPALVVSN